jgi:serine/threonine protein phosphatase 1
MRVLAIGDIHGCLRALDGLLAIIQPQPDDLIVTLGDYVDRGPDSRGAIERLLDLGDRFRLVALRGNHDLMLLAARDHPGAIHEWLTRGYPETLHSYAVGGRAGALDDVPARHWQFLESTLPYFETERHFFVHASAYPDLPLDEQPDYMLYWEKLEADAAPHESGKVMVCGHTAQRTGVPLDLGHAICIDTCVYGRGWLTGLDVATGQLWQARQSGATRTGWLGAPLAEVD